ncbi:MAG: formylglycine-generating enzyme family protein [Saprospiraceae bacterium]|nr:formylglycine-generating enzyme family protein [Saprospiraceae bacterium]
MKPRTILLILLSLTLLACKVSTSPKGLTPYNTPTPPGTVKVSDNLYFDKTEITNIAYLEFMFWIKNIYGTNSSEFIRILPDTNVWSKLNIAYATLDTFYLSHPVYTNFPVVGVSYDQAISYSKWRSDRVMELILFKNKIVPRPNTSKDSVFTIEKYYKGEYCGIQPNPHFTIYPYYSLPDSATYRKAAIFADSFNTQNYTYCQDELCRDKLLIESNCLENKIDKTPSRPFGQDPTLKTNCVTCKKELITHLKGNVREMTNIRGSFYGRSFIDSCQIPNDICRNDTLLINSYTGFRNVCQYKQWTD